MCAISGILVKKQNSVNYDMYNAIKKMIASMTHRGPDDEGICAIVSNNGANFLQSEGKSDDAIAYLGFNRLSIRDLSKKGHQPMLRIDGRVVVVFNGEIYNADSLKEQYLSGILFRSKSDTEVLLNLYITLGISKTVELLDGMFAFCIADMNTGKMYICRDRVGIKPLYYYKDNNYFLFASEIKAIVEARVFKPVPNKVAFYEMMMFRFNHKQTLIEGVNQFETGCYAEIDINNPNDIQINRYWSPEKEVSFEYKCNYMHYKKKVVNELEKAVTSQLISDVDVGCQLSGGIDSSLITYFFNKKKKEVANAKQIRNISFGIIPDNNIQSEEKYMDYVSAVTGIEVDKILVKNSCIGEQWKKVIWYLDGIPSFINEVGISYLAQESKNKGVTVLISGEGADEVFGGYSYISEGKYIITMYNLIKFFKKKANEYLRKKNLVDSDFDGKLDDDYYLLWSADGNYNDYVKDLCLEYSKYHEAACADRKETIKRISSIPSISLFDKNRCYNLSCRVAALCNRQDKMTMEYSIENRVPFLSNDVISIGLKIPNKYLCKWKKKLSHGQGRNPFIKQGKYILKDVAKDYYTNKFAFREKMGFPLPLEDFIINEIETDDFDDMLRKLEKRNVVDIYKIKEYCKKIRNHNEYLSGEAHMLWNIFSYEFFCEQFIDSYQ